MMRWLLTTPAGVRRAELEQELAPLGATVADEAPVPMDDEQAFRVEGPRDLPARLEGRATRVLGAYPDSDAEPYG